MGISLTRAAAVCASLSVWGCSTVQADFPSGSIHPPPAPLTYIGSLPRGQWTFGEVIWRPSGPCSEVSCEAGYNADPLFVSVKISASCCGQPGATIVFMASSRECPSPSYFVARPQFVARMTDRQINAFVAQKTLQVVESLGARCALPAGLSVPISSLALLTTGYSGNVR